MPEDGFMIAVFLDANAAHRDVWLSAPPAQQLLRLCKDNSFKIIYSEIVAEELKRQQLDKLNTLLGEGRALSKGIVNEFELAVETLRKRIDQNFHDLFSHPEIVRQPIAQNITRQLAERDLQRRRPFQENTPDQKSYGFRDALIWECLLDVLRSNEFSEVVFVTKDGGFLEGKSGLHEHLLSDLDALGVTHSQVIRVNSIFDANSWLAKKVSTKEADEEAALLASAAADAVYEIIGRSVDSEMGPGGEYEEPEFVHFSTGPLEHGVISDFEQLSEFKLSNADDNDTIIAEANFQVSIDGYISKAEWYTEEYPLAHLSEHSDHSFSAVWDNVVRVRVVLTTTKSPPQVVGVELHDSDGESDLIDDPDFLLRAPRAEVDQTPDESSIFDLSDPATTRES